MIARTVKGVRGTLPIMVCQTVMRKESNDLSTRKTYLEQCMVTGLMSRMW
jgi:hypothetical protein